MDLDTYLQTNNASELAQAVNVHPSMISQLRRNRRPCPETLAILIEDATKGAVPVETLCPDVPWHLLRGRKQKKGGASTKASA